jgi:hypothetical protein
MPMKIKYAYCEVCKKEVEQTSRKPLSRMAKTVWVICIVGTLGIAGIVYLIYLAYRPKIFCSTCFSKLKFSDKPFEKLKEKREAMTPKEKLIKKVEEEKSPEEAFVKLEPVKEKPVKKKPAEKKPKKKKEEEKKEKIYCSFCGEELDEDYPTCPYCQAARKF